MSRGHHHLDFPSYIPHQAKPAGRMSNTRGREEERAGQKDFLLKAIETGEEEVR